MLKRNDKPFGPKLAYGISLTLLLLAAACGPATPPDNRAADVTALRDLDAQWSKTAGTNDVDATVAYYSDDASLLPPNAPIITGKQAIRAAWATLLAPGVSLSWQADKVEAARSSDLGYMTGTYTMSTKVSLNKSPVTEHGKYVEVWKKQATESGRWWPTFSTPTLRSRRPRLHQRRRKRRNIKPSTQKNITDLNFVGPVARLLLAVGVGVSG